jgi:methylated-DNA-protein-cysteine methyltransferase-like protein
MAKLRSQNHPKKIENSGFFEMVYDVTRLIPYGRITSYGAIAKYLGSARSARMVGWALNGCHNQLPMIPAHRVVNRNGELSGKIHFGGANVMQQLLESEGITVKDDTVIHFKKLFWDPGKDLSKEY